MSIVDSIKEDLKAALKNKEEERVGVLRMLIADFQNRSKDKQAKGVDSVLSDEEAIGALQKEFKKRKDAIGLFRKGGREDLAAKEEAELKFLEVYLPKQASQEEIEAVVREVISAGDKDFGSLMKEAMKRLKGKADGGQVGGIIKSLLAQ